MIKFKSKIFDIAAVLGLTLITAIVYITNFHGNFWLTGWDNLHPEFNFLPNIFRALFSSWQEYQGLGLAAGHGHATELTREIILWFLNIFLPAIEIRKVYFASMILVGSLGMFTLLRNVFLEKVETHLRVILSFIAGSFYILNIATVQIFYVPYEAFAAHFAFLPWMIYSIFFFMRAPTRRNFLLFTFIQLLGTWQFYIPTLFIVYLFIAFAISLSISFPNFKQNRKVFITTILAIFAVNFYWLLPFIYFTITNINSQQDAYVNLLYTADAYAKNAQFGNLENATLFKSFLFDYVSFFKDIGFSFTIGAWKTWANSFYFLVSGYSFFVISIIGVIYALKRKKNLVIALLFIIFFGLLANQTFPFKPINDILRNFPLFDQVFRNPFTKFANSAMLFMIIFFTLGIGEIIHFLKTNLKIKNALIIPLFVLASYLVLVNIYMAPLWKGGLIYSSLKNQIPNEYFQTFDYFKNQPNGRIANLPQTSPNGWDYYLWGYQGSGFIWYGINQPILDRAFDVWNKDNENYYWEISQAIYSQNLNDLKKILNKYQISYLLVDGNLSTPASPKTLYENKINTMLSSSKEIKLDKTFGRIKIYKVNSESTNFVFGQNNLPNIGTTYNWSDKDTAYLTYGNYKTEQSPNIYFPFRFIFTGRGEENLEFNLKEKPSTFVFEAKIPENIKASKLIIPSQNNLEFSQIDKNDPTKVATKEASILLDGKIIKGLDPKQETVIEINKLSKIELIIPKIEGYFSNTSLVSSNLSNLKPQSCDQFNQGFLSLEKINKQSALLDFKSTHSNNCVNFALPQLSQNLSYIVSIRSQNLTGKSLFLTINNNESKRDDLIAYLPKIKQSSTSYYIIPSKEQHGLGYNLHLDNISVDNNLSENLLGEIKVYPFPKDFLTNIRLTDDSSKESTIIKTPTIEHNVAYQYEIKDFYAQNLILSQSFDKGWHAYVIKRNSKLSALFPFIFGEEQKDHFLVNNWENGWKISNQNNKDIVIIYIPQFFEYLGFLALFLAFLAALRFDTKAKI